MREDLERPESRGDLLPLDFEKRAWQVLRIGIIAGLVIFGLLRLINLTSDFPPALSWDGDAYTDEGLYAHDAINRVQDGSFYIEHDYNQFVTLPLMPMVKAAFFATFGVHLVTARLITVLFTLGLGVALYFLVRRFEDPWTALLAVLLLALNHNVFAFSRLAIDEVPLAFFVTASLALAVRVRGERWWLFAILSAAVFACAVMTKTSAIFAMPLVAIAIAFQELSIPRILLKFLLCCAVVLSILVVWYFLLIRPYETDFFYFYTLNLHLARTEGFYGWTTKFRSTLKLCLNVDPILPIGLLLFSPALLIFSPRYRGHPLLYLVVGWIVLYIALFAYYGRFYPRFMVLTVPPLAVWAAITLRHALGLRDYYRLLPYGLVFLLGLSASWQVGQTLRLVSYQENSFNEMAADILARVDADPSGNRVIMGHTASGVALRTGLTARNDRYSPHSIEDRLVAFNPGWAISEGEFRTFPNDPNYAHAEYFDRHFDIESVASYDVLDNFRGHKMHLYKLIPRDQLEPLEPVEHARLDRGDGHVPTLPIVTPPESEGLIRLLGHDWERIATEVRFGERYIHRGAVLNDLLFISGGFNDQVGFMADVWSSSDGARWRLKTGTPPWSARFAHAMVAHDGFLYLMGGYDGTLLNDVWRSPNGADWELLTDSAPWGPRSDFQAIVHDGAIHVMGGRGKGRRHSDVWRSHDGIEWTLLNENAWPPRSHFAAASHRGRLIIATGVDFDFSAGSHLYRRDVWASDDGREWTQLNDNVQMRGRALMQMISVGPTLFAMGGDDISKVAAMRRDTWISSDGTDWWRLVGTDKYGQSPYIEYELRINHVLLAKDNALYVIGGHQYDAGRFRGTGRYPGMWRNDNVWKSTGEHVVSDVP